MSKKIIARGLLAAVAIATLSACAPLYSPLASHTIKRGDKDEDIVWVVRDAREVVRCHDTERGPVCVTARQE
jgi:hypothetical protein